MSTTNKLENIQLRSDDVQEILNKIPSSILRYGSASILLIITIIMSVSWFVKYPDIIVSHGMLTTAVPPQKEYSKITTGIKHLLINNNDIVNKGQIIAVLQNAAQYKDVLLLEDVLDSIQFNNSNFYFPIDNLPILFLGDLEIPYAAFENAYVSYTLNNDLHAYDNDAVANDATRTQLQVQLSNTLSRKRTQKEELDYKNRELNRHKLLFEKGVIAAQEYELKQLEFIQNERIYQGIDNEISQLRNQISNANNLQRGIQINKTKEDLKGYKALMQSFTQLKKAINEYEELYIMRAKVNGRLSFTQYWKEEQQIQQGDLLFTVFPEHYGSYVATLKTPVLNIGKLKKGQKTFLKLQNFPESEFGVLQGNINTIAQVPDSEGFYYVQVTLPKKLVTSYNKEIALEQETVVVAETITEELRLTQRFLYQFRDIMKRN